jgi:hypothetical protein
MKHGAKIEKATKRLINSVWTITFVISDDKAHILRYDRDDPEGYMQEEVLMNGNIIEDEDRTAIKLALKPYDRWNNFTTEENASEIYEVANPKHIFDYTRG